MAIKTTRLKTAQVPRMITVDLTDQMDGIKQTFDLPMKVYSQMTHYLLFNGTVYRNSKRNTYYSIDKSGKVLTTYFTYPPEPSPTHSLQFVVSDNAEGSDMGTEVYIDDNKAIDLQISTNNGRIVEANGYAVGQYDDNEKARVEALVQNEAAARADADTEIENELEAKQDKLVQGNNITIDGNTISAAGSANIVKLTLTAHKLYLDGVEQHYTDIERLVETEGNYVVVYGDDDVVMKVSAVTSDAVEFATSYISGGEAFVQRVIINAEDEIKEDCLNVSAGGSSVTLYNGIGQNTDGALTQKASTDLLFDNADVTKIKIGSNAETTSTNYVIIGAGATTGSNRTGTVNVGTSSETNYNFSTAVGHEAKATSGSSTAIGAAAKATAGNASALGNGANASSDYATAIGSSSSASGGNSTAVGQYSSAQGSYSLSFGYNSNATSAARHGIALGSYSQATRVGEINVGTPKYAGLGFDSTSYRLISGVHDPVDAQDAATKAYVDAAIAALRTELGL